MPLEEGPGVLVQRLSIWKVVGMELFLAAGAVLPLTGDYSDRLVYTAFSYKMPFFILLVAACMVLGLMALVFLLLVWRAILRVPVLTISDTTITALLATRRRSVNKSDVLRVVSLWPGTNVNLEIRGARPLGLPVWFYEQPALVKNQLERLGTAGRNSASVHISS